MFPFSLKKKKLYAEEVSDITMTNDDLLRLIRYFFIHFSYENLGVSFFFMDIFRAIVYIQVALRP